MGSSNFQDAQKLEARRASANNTATEVDAKEATHKAAINTFERKEELVKVQQRLEDGRGRDGDLELASKALETARYRLEKIAADYHKRSLQLRQSLVVQFVGREHSLEKKVNSFEDEAEQLEKKIEFYFTFWKSDKEAETREQDVVMELFA